MTKMIRRRTAVAGALVAPMLARTAGPSSPIPTSKREEKVVEAAKLEPQ